MSHRPGSLCGNDDCPCAKPGMPCLGFEGYGSDDCDRRWCARCGWEKKDHPTADDLRHTPAGRELMAEVWSKFQDHYATEWETNYHEGHFPSPEPAPAVVSRESVAAFMMRHWAKNLRSDPNPYKEAPNE